jgi:hypothetical protein
MMGDEGDRFHEALFRRWTEILRNTPPEYWLELRQQNPTGAKAKVRGEHD